MWATHPTIPLPPAKMLCEVENDNGNEYVNSSSFSDNTPTM